MSRLEDFRNWIRQKTCFHDIGVFKEVVNRYDAKVHVSAFRECPKCGEVLAVEYSWSLPEGSRVIFPGGEHNASKVPE